MTPDRLAAIRAREQAATPGPWAADPGLWAPSDWPDSWGYRKVESVDALRVAATDGAVEGSASDLRHAADAVFIAHARQDVPALLDAVQRRDDALAAVLALCDEWENGEWDEAPRPRDVRAAITAHLPATPTTEETR